MTAPDGGAPGFAAADAPVLAATHAILLHGGRALMLFEGAAGAPPRRGQVSQGGASLGWTAECWRIETAGEARWCGLGLLDALPAADGDLQGEGEGDPRRWRLVAAPRVDIAPQPLADLVRKAGVDRHAVFDFLVRNLITGRPEDSAEALANQAFARAFFSAAAERDGFIEILAQPEGGGLFAQGWSMSTPERSLTLASAGGQLTVQDVEVAHFDRDDILPPGRGFCLFARRAEVSAEIEAVFFETEGRLLRLDVVANAVTRFEGAAATEHVKHMLPRMVAEPGALRSFKRICRPRFAGEDTLSSTLAPVAVGLDALLQAPDGGLFVMGWLLDPLRRVQLALIKSDQALYAPLQNSWVRLPRPDLCAGFAADPRFAGLLDPADALFGFVVHVPAAPEQPDGAAAYLELVLDDESCLFRPLAVTPFGSAERLPQILSALSPTEPETPRIVAEHLTPFLASVPPRPASVARSTSRPIPLGRPGPDRAVSAVMPVRSFVEVQPALGLLAGTPEADALDLVLVTTRGAAADMLRPLGEAFAFYGLRGALVIAGDRETLAARLDIGAAATRSDRLLAWSPTALPKAPGWLARLVAEADGLPNPGLVSPAMTYEDGSVYFGGLGGGGNDAAGPAGPVSPVAGYGRDWLARGATRPAASGAAEIALVGRALLARVGGFAGRLFGDTYAQVDLADRLARIGSGAWCSGGVEFWMLDDPHAPDPGPFARLMQQVDAGLLRLRGQAIPGDRSL